jgi:hypothetical protein
MRITDYIFFGLITAVLVFILAAIAFGFPVPAWIPFWWVLLLPIVFLKVVFPSSRITRWLEKARG